MTSGPAQSLPDSYVAAGPTTIRGRVLKPRATALDWISLAVSATLALLAVYPLSLLIVELFWIDGRISFGAIQRTAMMPDLFRIVLDTMIMVIASSAIALLVAAVFAWLNERTDARIAFLTDTLPLLPFLLPPVAGAIGWVLLLSPRAGYANAIIRGLLEPFGASFTEGPFTIFSWGGLVYVMVLYQVPYAFLMIVAGLRSLDPSLEEQSRISGAGLFQTVRRVTLRALGPSIAGAVLLMAWQGFALFSVPAIIGSPAGIEVLAVRIVRLLTFSYPPQVDVALGLSVIVAALVSVTWIVQRRVINAGHSATFAGKAHPTKIIRLAGWKWPMRILMLLYIFAAAIMPLCALIVVSLNGFWSLNIKWSRFSLEAFRTNVFEHPITAMSLFNSILIAAITATIGIIAAALISQYMLRHRGGAARSLDGVIKLPAVVSHVVIAVAFLIAFAGPPFQLGGTILILVLVYLVLYLPQASAATDAAVGQVSAELSEASRLAGAADAQTFRRISLPLILGSLVAGWSLMFTRIAGDLTASALLSGTGNPVVGFRILEIYTNGSFAALAALTLVLVAITFFIVAALFAWQRRLMAWSR